ncbi:unnamed protein product [Nippostrongylus brasiliensis]|uniref:Transposase n=1 Tax=Nippostrongylus brasiliensis TaxID=27835 RepID=A0A158QXZ8_NIPBR|nr:unnamed protein product [Nippostrongylus brasiliensis]
MRGMILLGVNMRVDSAPQQFTSRLIDASLTTRSAPLCHLSLLRDHMDYQLNTT